MRDQTAKVTVLLSKEQFGLFDAYCQLRGFKKSTLIARLVRDHLVAEGFSPRGAISPSLSGEAGAQRNLLTTDDDDA